MEWIDVLSRQLTFDRINKKNVFENIERNKFHFSSEYLPLVSEYLINPTGVGLWKFEFENYLDSGFCKYLLRELDDKLP